MYVGGLGAVTPAQKAAAAKAPGAKPTGSTHTGGGLSFLTPRVLLLGGAVAVGGFFLYKHFKKKGGKGKRRSRR